jgi:hypothetical protein
MLESLMIRVLFLKDGPVWVAQGLDYDVAAQGRTIAAAKQAFVETLVGRLRMDMERKFPPLYGLSQAPRNFWAIYETVAERCMHLNAERIDSGSSRPHGLPPAFIIPVIQHHHSHK